MTGRQSRKGGKKETAQKVNGGSDQQSTTFSFTVGTSTGRSEAASEKGEDKLAFDWSLLKQWAEANLSATSQAQMLFESEQKDRMSVEEAVSKFVVIKRLFEDELKRQGR